MLYFGNNSTINLDSLYKETLVEIDKFRTDECIADKELTIDNIHQVEKNLKPNPKIKQTYNTSIGNYNILSQRETRSHAFYRILGLPMTDGVSFFNPGYDSNKDKDELKIKICNRILKTDSYKTLEQSGFYQESMLNVLQKKDINASVLVLSSLNKRNFADCIKDPSQHPVAIIDDDVSYNVSMNDFSNKNYNQYIDYKNRKPESLAAFFGKNGATRKHYILPLALNPKIVFAITDLKNINAPFFILKGPNCDPSIQYSAPTLQSIIIERFSNKSSPAEITQSQQDIINNINNLPKVMNNNNQIVKDVEIIDSVFKQNKNNSYYANFITTATELMKILKQSVEAAKSAQQKYNLIPLTEGSSPEQIVSISKIYALDPNNSQLDKKIVSEILKSTSKDIEILFGKSIVADNSPTNTSQSTVLSNVAVAPSKDPVKIDDNNFNYQKLTDQRKKEEEIMKRSLKYIEYLMGEFSGFGICDMFVIISALYLLEDNVLISLLDDDSFDRAKDPSFKLSFLPEKSSRIEIVEALKKLTETIRNLYLTMDAIYLSLAKY